MWISTNPNENEFPKMNGAIVFSNRSRPARCDFIARGTFEWTPTSDKQFPSSGKGREIATPGPSVATVGARIPTRNHSEDRFQIDIVRPWYTATAAFDAAVYWKTEFGDKSPDEILQTQVYQTASEPLANLEDESGVAARLVSKEDRLTPWRTIDVPGGAHPD